MKYCSFCGKPESSASLLMAGNDSYICSECVELAKSYINSNKEISFHKSISEIPKPSKIKEFLDQYIIGQDVAKERISVAVYNHYKRISSQNIVDDVEIEKSNCLLVGPSGTGKTLIAKTIAKMLDVPFAIVDCTSLTQAGYVGDDVENILVRLLQSADYNVERAEMGIVFIDEIDKIGRKGGNPSISRDVSGEGVQQALLKIIEGSVVGVPPQGGRKHPEAPLVYVNTKNILFICGGAFEGIEKKIEERYNVHSIGFNSINDSNKNIFNKDNPLNHISPDDLKQFGLIPEIIGRLPVITYMENLDKKALRKILTEPKNALVKQYQKLFMFDGIELTYDKKVLDYIVDRALSCNLGARGLRVIMEDLMTKSMFDSPDKNINKLNIDYKYAKKILGAIEYK